MRNILAAIFSSVLYLSCLSQEIITKKNGEQFKTRIMEILPLEVKYRIYGDTNSIVYTILKSDIFMIQYEDGKKELFNGRNENNQVNLYLCGQELLKFKRNYYTGVGFIIGGAVVEGIGYYLGESSVLIVGGLSQITGLVFIFSSFSHIGKAGTIMLNKTNTVGFNLTPSKIGLTYKF